MLYFSAMTMLSLPVPSPLLPLALGVTHPIATYTTENGEPFTVTFGLDTHTIALLKEKSCDITDTELHRFASDYGRFCEGAYATWFAKERYPFGLLSATGDLAGIVWFGPHECPLSLEPGVASVDTFAIRMYHPFRGKRLARPFAQYALEFYLSLRGNVRIWLDVEKDNEAGRRLYEKLNFKEIGYTDSDRVVMVLQ